VLHYLFILLLFWQIFTRTSPYTLGRAACVCQKWKYTARNPTLWRTACLKTWQVSILIFSLFGCHVLTFFSSIQFYNMKRSRMETNYQMVRSLYDSSWRRMWLQRPRIRSDGKFSRIIRSYYMVHYYNLSLQIYQSALSSTWPSTAWHYVITMISSMSDHINN
jgi:hypothetical protein